MFQIEKIQNSTKIRKHQIFSAIQRIVLILRSEQKVVNFIFADERFSWILFYQNQYFFHINQLTILIIVFIKTLTMHSSQNFDALHSGKLPIYNSVPEKVFYQKYSSQFQYKKGKKYIRITEERSDIDCSFSELPSQSQDSKVVKSYILDQDLHIVCQTNHIIDLDEEVLKKQELFNKQNSSESERQKYLKKIKLSYLTDIFITPQFTLNPIKYIKYPKINDFIVGRNHFVRQIQSHKISSDTISKIHCQVMHFKSNSPKIYKYLSLMKGILAKKTPIFSKWRKMPEDIWHNISQYLKPLQKYLILDTNSRNGTWIYENATQIYCLKQNFDYQFERQTYSIRITKMYTSKNSEGENIAEHNKKAFQMIEQFKKQVNWNYLQIANRILLVEDPESQTIATKTDEKMQILIFNIKYHDYHVYYLLAVSEGSKKKYSIGCKYNIDINPEEYDAASLHGHIYFSNNGWMIESFETKRNGQYRKIWTKLAKDQKFQFNTSKSYNIKLGNLYFMNIEFKNFF